MRHCGDPCHRLRTVNRRNKPRSPRLKTASPRQDRASHGTCDASLLPPGSTANLLRQGSLHGGKESGPPTTSRRRPRTLPRHAHDRTLYPFSFPYLPLDYKRRRRGTPIGGQKERSHTSTLTRSLGLGILVHWHLEPSTLRHLQRLGSLLPLSPSVVTPYYSLL